VVFERLGEDEFVQQKDREFRGVLRLFPIHVAEGTKPTGEILEELGVEVGLFVRVLGVPEHLDGAELVADALNEVGKWQLGEEGACDEAIAGAIQERGAQIGEDDVFALGEVFFDLRDVARRLERAASQFGIAVFREERF